MTDPQAPVEPATCAHPDFDSFCDIHRMSDVDGGPITNYALDVRVVCRVCRLPFKFIGLPMGLDLNGGATTSVDREEARLVISPDGVAPKLAHATGFRITQRTGHD